MQQGMGLGQATHHWRRVPAWSRALHAPAGAQPACRPPRLPLCGVWGLRQQQGSSIRSSPERTALRKQPHAVQAQPSLTQS